MEQDCNINNKTNKIGEMFEEFNAPLTREEEQAVQYEKIAKRLDDIQNDVFKNPILSATQKVSFSQKIRPVIGHCTGKVRFLRGEIDIEEIKKNKKESSKMNNK